MKLVANKHAIGNSGPRDRCRCGRTGSRRKQGCQTFCVRGQLVLRDRKPATKTFKSRDLVTRPKDRRVRIHVLHHRAADDYTSHQQHRDKTAPVPCSKQMSEAFVSPPAHHKPESESSKGILEPAVRLIQATKNEVGTNSMQIYGSRSGDLNHKWSQCFRSVQIQGLRHSSLHLLSTVQPFSLMSSSESRS